jgi:hypothetical protein
METANAEPYKSRPIKAGEVRALADKYEALRLALWGFYSDVLIRPSMLAQGREMPSSGTPD